ALQHAALPRARPRGSDRRWRHEQVCRRVPCRGRVEHAYGERRGVDLPLAPRGKPGQERGERDAAGARAEDVDIPDAGDVAHGVDRLLECLDVAVEPAVRERPGRIAPADYERLHAAVERPADDAVPGPRIEDVG